VSAFGAASIDGSSTIFQTGILSQANPGSSGNAGSVSLVNAGQISASTIGLGAGGDVNVQLAENSQ
jgi:hypothetical protein